MQTTTATRSTLSAAALLALLATAATTSFATETPITGAHPVGLFRIVSHDGATVLASAPVSAGTQMVTMTIDASKAFMAANGRCAFDVKYDEVSDKALFGTVNQIYDNDVLVAQNSAIDLAPNVVKTIWTQPYLQAGTNTLRLVTNTALGDKANKAWVRVQVNGTCAAAATPPAPPASSPTKSPEPPHATPPAPPASSPTKSPEPPHATPPAPPASSPTKSPEPPHATPPAPPASSPTKAPEPPKAAPSPAPAPAPVVYAAGSSQWQALYNAWGYSNYGVTQLKGKGYARYDELYKLNADLTTVVKAGKVEAGAWTSLMARWASFTSDPGFQAAMKAIVPTQGH